MFWKFESKSHHSSTSINCCSSSSFLRISRNQVSLSIFTSSYNQACHKSDVQEGAIVKSGYHIMVTHDMKSDKHCVLCGVVAMAVDLSKLGTKSGKKYGEQLDDPVYVCGSQNVLSTGQLIDFCDPTLTVMDCVEKLSTR